ncbi:inorganic phosphate transporter [Devosia nitrariae]|uniref:Phosphate transporter n=1 Tax=Devosia nitrariae TaxID=2071872 RepID=A0ABQ5W266_9HYPH|nr:inorganic phosphate transporter [Devosia nitrariae]GLQ54159.1 phosphate transporter [Devosia nitrariae]
MNKSVLDKDLKKVVRLETAMHDLSLKLAAPGLAALFILAVLMAVLFSIPGGPFSYLVVIAAVISAYMALNVGANDVANNMGPAVGGRALTMAGALIIAAICEAAGALLAGGDVVTTVSSKLLSSDLDISTRDFILVMSAASLASAMWIHIATVLNAPVSTTHSVVGGVVGAGIAAAGFSVVAWPVIGTIVLSWIVSPMMGGVLASALLAVAHFTILDKADKLGAARRWVPIFVALMTGVFAMYLAAKGLSRVWKPDLPMVVGLGVVAGVAGYAAAVPWVGRRVPGLENRVKHVSGLFRLPLILATALLSFAHGANDVANAVGPLAAIVAAANAGVASPDQVPLPLWVLGIGAIGIAVGLALFGPRLIRVVGEKITKMNEVRAYCVALSAAVTVLIASALGLPISSTHVAVGAIFGVGLLREYHSNEIIRNPPLKVKVAEARSDQFNRTAEEAVKQLKGRDKRRLVRRRHALTIGTAWIITVPASALVAGLLYALMRLLPGG